MRRVVHGTAGSSVPYHSWSYGLDGSVWTAPGFKELASWDPTEHGLAELPCEEWHGLVFVDGSGEAAPLAESLADLEPFVAPYEPERLRLGGIHDYVVESNWKILTENYHECYHCPMIHPELCQVSPPTSGITRETHGAWVGGNMDLRRPRGHHVARRVEQRRPAAGPVGRAAAHRRATSTSSRTCSSACTPTS